MPAAALPLLTVLVAAAFPVSCQTLESAPPPASHDDQNHQHQHQPQQTQIHELVDSKDMDMPAKGARVPIVTSWSYTAPSDAMWTADDWILPLSPSSSSSPASPLSTAAGFLSPATESVSSFHSSSSIASLGEFSERPWQNLVLACGNATVYAQLTADVLQRTGVLIPTLWLWTGWLDAKGNHTLMKDLWSLFLDEYKVLVSNFPHLPAQPYGIFMGDEPGLLKDTRRQQWLASGLALVKNSSTQFKKLDIRSNQRLGDSRAGNITLPAWTQSTTPPLGGPVTYINLLYASIACDSSYNATYAYCCCGDQDGAAELAQVLGQMQLDWISSDEYYDVPITLFEKTYRDKLYPHLRDDQKVLLVPFAAYCELGCEKGTSLVPAADARCLGVAQAHEEWFRTDERVLGMAVYRLKNIWRDTQSGTDVCLNEPNGNGLGLVDRCGVGATGDYATPLTLSFYQNLTAPPQMK